jgi:hypothetical protein
MKKYRVMIKRNGKFATYRICETREEANQTLTTLNARLISKAYKRAIKRGRAGIGHEAWQLALSQTAIQF